MSECLMSPELGESWSPIAVRCDVLPVALCGPETKDPPRVAEAALSQKQGLPGRGTSVTLPAQAQVVVCGGGIMGTSAAYHLAKVGWKGTVHLEQGRLAAGSARFCAGIVSTARHLSTERKMADYSNCTSS